MKSILNKNTITYAFALVCFGIIFYCLFLGSASVRAGDVGFNTDLARDFLLLENIEETHKPTLLGPRSGGIPGLFHGPLWIYLNLPAYLIVQGDPIGVGWFWIGLIAILVGLAYVLAHKLFGHVVGLVAAVLVAAASVPTAASLFNPFGAVLFASLFFYLFYRYIITNRVSFLLFALLTLGIIIQFQVAFGGPLLILATIIVLYRTFVKRQLHHLLAFLILLIPFSTYILFDIRHDFLQLNAIIAYLTGGTTGSMNFNLIALIPNRFEGIINSLVGMPYPPLFLTILIVSLFVYLFYKALQNRKDDYTKFLQLFFYFFLGYWLIAFLFKGVIWSYYYWPFMPLTLMVIASSIKVVNKYLYAGVISIFFIVLIQVAQASASNYTPNTVGKDGGSWLFNYHLAQKVFSDNEKSFGYYIFTPDQYGYSPRYAMNYLAKKQAERIVSPYQKQSVTYLLIAPPGGKDKSIGGDWWKKNKVNITEKPTKVMSFENGFTIEKYALSEKEISVPSDPNLIDTLIFR